MQLSFLVLDPGVFWLKEKGQNDQRLMISSPRVLSPDLSAGVANGHCARSAVVGDLCEGSDEIFLVVVINTFCHVWD